ncbi:MULTISPECIES: type II toxin-antitoxin system RelE family toxin [Corynebacterium]|uniref:type II toxin-antitoxin system RelE family toxin n=1 Tax=Corynebacterium TaxID=1716 RepID=UPI001F27449C|nr:MULTISPECIES: type II toxin-antitoxin system RelE/ParE family toxin [Corynebacterium]MDK4240220.1 type II toxin-antitoxin system RelE/ParE family toxin [Corynebacterium pseudodiphtheriticum]MDK4258350.1 type II toxin-antitoxin system RelE/ParE family toxin [Corynebacterium propinquum]MDK4293239.1 type II toxin-antitoxin system RelE/ParE family toxin [Corynebacterium propinquum]MDK4299063.1 type II toxin-antitoxin system RelE/ParE family toxin [Corynebacterium propinquum]
MQRRVSRYLRELAALDDPRSRGKALVGDKSGLWRWRVGDYRVIADIYDEQVTIIVLDMGHRRNIYE